jgi:hypothetical protein
MAKKKRQIDEDEAGRDPLGKLLLSHHVSIIGVLLVAGVVVLIGLGIIAFALLREPISLLALAIGAGVLLLAMVFVGMNVFNVGRRLELRKRGVRFVEFGHATEIYWDDIADIEVDRTDDTYLGVASVRRRSANAAPTGPLTKTEWNVTIRSHDGRTIRLRSTFLRTVSDPKKLISQLRLRAGLA